MTNSVPVLFGEVLFDCFEDGSRVLGGAPFNVAWHLQAFGCDPLLISRVGDDRMGHRIRKTMFDWGMSTAGLQLDSARATGEVRVSLTDGQPDFEILADRAWDDLEWEAIPPLRPALVYHGSLGLRSPQSAACFQSLDSRYSAPRYLDVNLRPPWWQPDSVMKLIAGAHWLKINDDELTSLTTSGSTLQERAERLLADSALELVIVTRGAEGAFALNRQGEYSDIVPGGTAQVVDTVGAGDAFAAVTILGILQQWPVAPTLRRAQQFASLIVSQRGATKSDKGLYGCLCREWGIRPLRSHGIFCA